MLTLMILTTGIVSTAFATADNAKQNIDSKYGIVLDGKVVNVEKLAKENDVDPDELKAALLAGPDADGRYSPFSHVRQLGTKSTQELASIEKKAPNGSPLFIMKKEGSAAPNNTAKENLKVLNQASGYVLRSNQDTTAYTYTGKPGASGTYPYLGSFACHRYSNNSPYIPYGKHIYLDRYVWLPDNYYHSDFVSNDTGTGRPNTWWVDIYYDHSVAAALNYGVINLSYNQEL